MLKQKPAFDLPHYKSFHLFWFYNDVTINDLLHNLFFVFSQKVVIAETRLNAVSEDINKVLLIKPILQQLKLI